MSKTDKTRPWNVKASEHPREFHDHRDGVCDIKGLAPTARNIGIRGSFGHGRCHFDAQWFRPEMGCGCAWHGPDGYGTPRRRRERHAAQRETRAAETAGYERTGHLLARSPEFWPSARDLD